MPAPRGFRAERAPPGAANESGAMKNRIFAALGLICLAGATNAETSGDDSRRSIERRAVEAVIWGIPAVNYDLMYQEMLKLGGRPVVYWSRLPDWKNQTLTPNPDVIYLMPFFNTKDA